MTLASCCCLRENAACRFRSLPLRLPLSAAFLPLFCRFSAAPSTACAGPNRRPGYDRSRQPQPFSFDIGLFETLEIRVPVSPWLAIVMTWLDDEDQPEVVRGTRELAANLNAFTVAQAERQWFHRPGRVPPRASGQLLPLSTRLLERYDSRAAERSGRRRVISQKVKEMVDVDLEQTEIELVTVSRP